MLSDRDYFRPQGGSATAYWQRHSIIFHLIVINIVVFFLDMLTTGARSYSPLFVWGCLVPCDGYIWQIWRFITYQFLHRDFMHIFFNMYALWLFGRMIEPRLGRARFLTLYLFSGVLGGIFYTLANYNAPMPCIGASGATFGVMVAAAMTYPNAEFFLMFPPIRMKLWVMVLVYCGIELFSELSGGGRDVAHLAHLGGALGGFLFMRRLGALQAFFKRNDNERGSAGYSQPRRPTPPPNNAPFVFDQAEINRILDKMSRQGYEQLTEQERWTLQKASEELKRRRNNL
jgi:membrane associated rhomboid family serine protease